ncbi:hypothetical protein DFS34DRAFT_101380 [Phlyctochytrium arcticum]|nr:hypothetical protein DFS34DRAFT_101380 [Phlyctochytrium arcticum]
MKTARAPRPPRRLFQSPKSVNHSLDKSSQSHYHHLQLLPHHNNQKNHHKDQGRPAYHHHQQAFASRTATIPEPTARHLAALTLASSSEQPENTHKNSQSGDATAAAKSAEKVAVVVGGGEVLPVALPEPATVGQFLSKGRAASAGSSSSYDKTPILLQRIGALAHQVFAAFPGRHPKHDQLVARLMALLQKVTPETLQVKAPRSPVEYYPIHESSAYTLCAFVLQRGTLMPTHDHPQMTVFSKIVSGDLHVRTYEFASNGSSDGSGRTLNGHSTAGPYKVFDDQTDTLVAAHPTIAGVNRVISSTEPDSLLLIHPDSGPNMHAFTAVSETVVLLDLIGPPYTADDRPCTYFKEVEWQAGCERIRACKTRLKAREKKRAKRMRQGQPKPVTSSSAAATAASDLLTLACAARLPSSLPTTPLPSSPSPTRPHTQTPPPPPLEPPSSYISTPSSTPPPPHPTSDSDSDSLSFLDTSGAQTLCWLVEDPDVDYRCVERVYTGQPVTKVDRYSDKEFEAMLVVS